MASDIVIACCHLDGEGSDQWHWHSWGLATLSPGEVLWLKSKQKFLLLAWCPALLLAGAFGWLWGQAEEGGFLPAGAAAGMLQQGRKASWIWSDLSDQLSHQPTSIPARQNVCELIVCSCHCCSSRTAGSGTQMESGKRVVVVALPGEEVCAKVIKGLWESLFLAE